MENNEEYYEIIEEGEEFDYAMSIYHSNNN